MPVPVPVPESHARPPGGPAALQEEVLAADQCTSCGMCLDLCPWLAERHERVAFVWQCPRESGTCHAVCPRTHTDLAALRDACVPGLAADPALGPHRSVLLSRAADPALRGRGQYGATVTALALHGLTSGVTDAALLTAWGGDPGQPLLPRPLLATTPDQVLEAAGSKYTACPTLRLLARCGEARRVLVVGRPCQVTAVRKRTALADPPPPPVALVVGLFCMWALPYRALRALAGDVAGTPRRVDVPQGRFVVETDRTTAELPHDQVAAAARPACRTCYDFTAELADLSVGSTEWKDDWNTLIVRTEAGQALVDAAAGAGALELAAFPEERTRLLRRAALDKRRRVLRLLEERRLAGLEPYLVVPAEERRRVLDGAGEG